MVLGVVVVAGEEVRWGGGTGCKVTITELSVDKSWPSVKVCDSDLCSNFLSDIRLY